MRIPRLFIDMPLVSGELVLLPFDQVHHISHVLRMRVGDAIKIFNGNGYEYESKIVAITKKNAQIKVGTQKQITHESPLTINLCLAVTRAQQMDFSVQKAVELGVKNIIPVITEFGNVKIQDRRLQNKLTHWQNIIISATEQCGRCVLTQIQAPVAFSEWLVMQTSSTRLILQPRCGRAMQTINRAHDVLTLIIGAEGGFSEHELNWAQAKGCVPVSLGPRILRAETAVVSAISNAQQLWGDLN